MDELKDSGQKRKSYYRPRLTKVQNVINWANPTAEDIAAGLSEEQRSALLELRPDNSRGPHEVALDKPIAAWRGALIIKRGYGEPVILTSMGARVRAVLEAGQ